MSVKVGLLYSRIRTDEKLLLEELRERGHDVVKIDVRDQQFGLSGSSVDAEELDIVVDRCVATSRSMYVTEFFESYGVPIVNPPDVASTCSDKVKTSLALKEAGIPTPDTRVAFTRESAMEAIEDFGYPVVLKPVVGSWGRLMARIEDEHAAEAILEHKETLGHYEHKIFYIQEFVEKPGRDLRVLSLDGEPVAGMVRSADHWITNAHRGAETDVLEITPEIEELVRRASDAVGGGLLGVDLMETADGYTIHEINHTVEYKALADAVEIDIVGAVVDWLEERAANAENDHVETAI
ncbi:MAG: lysine biosynthesis protein LysX [Halodesulfurarchaeum sp.]